MIRKIHFNILRFIVLMINLEKIVCKWGLPEFELLIKSELEHMSIKELPLQQGLSTSNFALDDELNIIIIKTSDSDNTITVKVGVFYFGIISGCSCADDPGPVEKQNEYCEVQLDINKISGETRVKLLAD